MCPPNRTAERRYPPPAPDPGSEPWVPLEELLAATDQELLARHGRFYLPDRDPNILRRNALLAWGNVAARRPSGERVSPASESLIRSYGNHPDATLRDTAAWALHRAGLANR